MVRFLSSLLLLAGLILPGLSTPIRRTVAQIEADIVAISEQATAFDNATKLTPIGTLSWIVNIHARMPDLSTSLDTGTTDIRGNLDPVSDSDGRVILDGVEAFLPSILDGIASLVKNKPPSGSIGGLQALILQDLKFLDGALASFFSALIALLPPDLASEAAGLGDGVNVALDNAIAAYS